MAMEHPAEELILRAFRTLDPEDKNQLHVRFRDDPEALEDLADILTCMARQDEPSRPLEEFLAEQGFDAA